MGLSEDIQRIQQAKVAIKAAIAGKGVTVPQNAKISDLAELVSAIDQSGVISEDLVTGTMTPSANASQITVNTGMSANEYSYFVIFPLDYGSSHEARAVGLHFVDFAQGHRVCVFGSTTNNLVTYTSSGLLDNNGMYGVTRDSESVLLQGDNDRTGHFVAGTTYKWYAW